MRNYIILALLILSFSNAFTQENPYEIFGLESKVKYETKISEYLTVKNTDTNSAIKSMVFNMDEEVIIFLGNNDTILKTVKIKPEQLLRFLSVDPLTKDYPWYTPYQFAGNKPIMAIDLDGLEENVVIYQDKGEGKTFMRSCKYSDLYPGQKHGPFGKTGTAIVVLNTFANDRNTYVDADVQYQFINNKNKLVSMDMGKFDIYKEPKESWYKKNIGNKLEGGYDPANEGAKIPENGSVALGVSGAGAYGVGVSVSFAWDNKGGNAIQLNFEQALGYEAPGINLTFTEYTPINRKNFSVSDLKDASVNNSGGAFIYSFGKGENYDNINNKKGNIYSSKSFSLNVGMDSAIPFSAKHSEGYTVQTEFKTK